jgi:hypothetical protein
LQYLVLAPDGPIYTTPMSELVVGDVFAGHRLEGVAGRGGMGVVYRARQLSLERTVALKVIAPALMEDAGIRRRFVRESKVAASIDHPNVIPVYYAGEEGGVAYIAMRYVAGEDLRALVRREGGLAPERAAGIGAQVGAALDAAHAAGLVHRDVKPANVLLGPGDHAYLTDFGLTKHVLSLADATQPGHWVGTLDFVAPEQIRGERVDARADVYALGCLLHFALTGAVPFPRDNQEAKLWAHLSDPPPRVSAERPELPAAFDAVIARALAKDAEQRYPSAGDLGRAALAAAAGEEIAQRERNVAVGAAAPVEVETQTGETALKTGREAGTVATPEATRPLPAERPSRRWLLPAGALAVAAAAAGLLFSGVLGDPPAPSPDTPAPTPPARTEVAATIRIGQRPNAIAIGGGRVWVGRFGHPRLVAIDPATNKAIPRLTPTVGIGTVDMVMGGGTLWVALARERRLVRLDPRTGRQQGAPIALPAPAVAVTYADGAPWVALDGAGTGIGDMVARIDPETGQITASDQVLNGVVAIKAVRGAVWVLTGEFARLIELDPQGRRRSLIKLRGRDAGGLAYGAGAFWVTLSDFDQVAKVDLRTRNPAIVEVGSGPEGIVVQDGRAWVANRTASTVTQISTRTFRTVGDPIDVETNPVKLASAPGAVWVTSVGGNAVQRIRIGRD